MDAETADLGALDRRVALLERRLGRLRWIVVALALCAGVAAVLAARPRRPAVGTVVAEKFVVRDREGRERAVLGLDHPGSPAHSPVRLGLSNQDGGSSAVMYLSDGFAGLGISTTGRPEGRSSLTLFANPREGGGLKVETGVGRTRIEIEAAPRGEPRLILRDDAGAVLFGVP
jgi:hypothetical protein